jgi:hypothetical protein
MGLIKQAMNTIQTQTIRVPSVALASNTDIVKRKKWSLKKKIGIGILLAIIFFAGVQYLSAARYEAMVQVIDGNRVGINPTGEKLDFGDLPRNKTATRIVTLTNESPYKLNSYIIVWPRGELGSLLDISKNFFTLKPGQKQTMEFRVNVPNSAESRYYNGKVVIFQLPKPW